MTLDGKLLSIKDIAVFTGLSDHTIRRAIKDCELPATILRGRYRVAERDLVAWIDAGRVTPTFSGYEPPFIAPPPPPRRSTLTHREWARQMRRDREAAPPPMSDRERARQMRKDRER